MTEPIKVFVPGRFDEKLYDLLTRMVVDCIREWETIRDGQESGSWMDVPGLGYLRVMSSRLRRKQIRTNDGRVRSLYHSRQYRSHAVFLNVGVPGHGCILLDLDELLAVRRHIKGETDD